MKAICTINILPFLKFGINLGSRFRSNPTLFQTGNICLLLAKVSSSIKRLWNQLFYAYYFLNIEVIKIFVILTIIHTILGQDKN